MVNLSLFLGSSDLIMVGRGWLWVMVVKLWLLGVGGGKLMPCRMWSWVVAAKLWLVVGGCR